MIRHLLRLWPVPVFIVPLLAAGLLGPKVLASLTASGAANAPAFAPAPTAVSSLPPAAPTTPAASQASSSRTQTAGKTTKHTVVAYYVPYDPTSWASFQTQASSIDYVDGQWVTVNACGGIGSRDDRTLIAYADQHGTKVLPSLLTGSQWLNHRLLTDPATFDNYLSEILRYVNELGYPGFDLDMENIADADRDAYSAFVAKLADALHKRDKILTLAIPAKFSDVRTGWAGPFDYAALGKSADLILLMTYDYSWATGPAGSIAPQDWVDKVAAYAGTQIPPQKVLIGLAFYGYDWNKTTPGRARALIYSQATALAKQYGTKIVTDQASRSASFSYTAKAGDSFPLPASLPALQHDITVRNPAQCGVKTPPAPTPTPTPVPNPAIPQSHVVWLEDATSVAGRLQIAIQHGLGGVGAWRLGQEDPAVWPRLDAYRSGE